jgi:hypothetical protein
MPAKRPPQAPHGIVGPGRVLARRSPSLWGWLRCLATRLLIMGQLVALTTSSLWGKVEKVLGKVVPSSQQAAVWDFMGQGAKPRTICYVAFNTAIVEEFAEKYAGWSPHWTWWA